MRAAKWYSQSTGQKGPWCYSRWKRTSSGNSRALAIGKQKEQWLPTAGSYSRSIFGRRIFGFQTLLVTKCVCVPCNQILSLQSIYMSDLFAKQQADHEAVSLERESEMHTCCSTIAVEVSGELVRLPRECSEFLLNSFCRMLLVDASNKMLLVEACSRGF